MNRATDNEAHQMPILSGLTIGNFKAFRNRQDIPLKPLTFVYGPNSSGKSSIIHALLLGHHATVNKSFDCNHPALSGSSVDLGGFDRYLFEPTEPRGLLWGISHNGFADGEIEEPLPSSVEATIGGWPLTRTGAEVEIARPSSVIVRVQDLFAALFARRSPESDSLRLQNLQEVPRKPSGDSMLSERVAHRLATLYPAVNLTEAEWRRRAADVLEDTGRPDSALAQSWEFEHPGLLDKHLIAFPPDDSYFFDRELGESYLVAAYSDAEDEMRAMALDNAEFDWKQDRNWSAGVSTGQSLFDRLEAPILDAVLSEIVNPTFEAFAVLHDAIKRLDYLGPLRYMPPRLWITPEDTEIEMSQRAAGLDSWRRMAVDQDVRRQVNNWLGSDQRLASPYELIVSRRIHSSEQWNEVDVDDADRSRRGLLELQLHDRRTNSTVSHWDVGVGVSQVLPVLVRAYGGKRQLICMEQPEIHLHPAMQAELADVFIESALGSNANQFVIESHSEHLVLRIMRRMRETAQDRLPDGLPRVRPDDVAVLYVQPRADGQGSDVLELRLDDEGEFLDPWPSGFFEEGFRERFC